MVEKQFSSTIKIFQSDGGGEFIGSDLIKHLENCGIIKHVSCSRTPEQNRVSERKPRHVVEIGLILLFHAKLLQFLWVETFLTVVFLINRMSSLILKNELSFVILDAASPDYNNLKVFGCGYIKGRVGNGAVRCRFFLNQ